MFINSELLCFVFFCTDFRTQGKLRTFARFSRHGYSLLNILDLTASTRICTVHQGSQIRQIWRILRQNCSDDSTEVTEGVTSTPKIFSNKQGATLTPEIFGNKHSFVLTFFATNTIYVNCKCCKAELNHRN